MKTIKIQNSKSGFTLIELLVVIAILGILSTVGLLSFRISQAKARDAQRKSDLEQVQRALEMYHNDYNDYPSAIGGLIMGILWGEEFKDAKDTVYMKELPQDPKGTDYCYEYNIGPPVSYRLYAILENTQTLGYGGPYSCGGSGSYSYAVGSSNLVAPTGTP